MVAAIQARTRGVSQTEEYVPTHTVSQPDPQWYLAKMRDLYERDPQLLDPSWRAYFATETAPPQLRAKRPAIPEGAIEGSAPEQAAPASSMQAPEVPVSVTPPTLDIEEAEHAHPTPPVAPVVSVTRSDLPPAPPAAVAEATSPYTRQQHGRAAFTLFQGAPSQDELHILKSAARATAKHMEASLSIPTATSQRQIPAKLLIENRALINAHLARTVGGKVSFTHLIGYALVEALCEMPDLNVRYTLEGGKPAIEQLAHIGFGLAIDVADAQGNHSLKVPVIHDADTLTFSEFVDAYQDLVARARNATLTTADFQGASVTLTNPGTLGTTTSVPRLMVGQGLIIGVGATDYPAEFRGVSPKRLASLGIGKTMYFSSTYDHRIIQGAASGRLLGLVDAKLSGRDGFYERVFTSMHVPTRPYSWEADYEYDPEREKGKPARIAEIIHAYRSRGHLAADTDPLAYRVRRHPDLDIASYGLSVWDLDRPFPTGGFGGSDQMLLRDILTRLHDTYTRTVGIEYMHIQDPEQRAWVQHRIERPYMAPSPEAQRHILDTLIRAEAFEEFLQTKFMGQKRFSLEGGESLIPLLDHILADSARTGIHEVAIGMAHRGRLNVLANIAGKSYAQIFDEFEGNYMPNSVQGSGDVKYHLGTWGVYSLDDGLATKVYMGANPSHLEAADGVLEGIVRAKQEHLGDPDLPIIPILIHGDAAFIGQGVVQETLNLSQLEGYKTGGTIHIIVNNQIGFTTGPTQGRSTGYATDLAKGLQVPILHVNADDPEAVIRCAHLAFEYRNAFHKDVIIDMVCYRRRGHNEGDDPSMTQPVMYSLIDRIPSTRAVYIRGLVGRGQLTEDEARQSIAQYEAELGRILEETRAGGASSVSEVNPGSRTHDPALTAGVGEAGEANTGEQLIEIKIGDLRGAHAPGDIFGDTLSENKEFGALAHEGGPADSPEDPAALARPRARFSAREQEGEGGLARPVVSEDDGVFGPFEAKGDAAQGRMVGARVGEVDVGEGQGQGGRGRGLGARMRGAGGRLQEWVPARVEGDAAEDGTEEPAGGEDQEGHADEARDGDPDPPPVDEPLAELVARVDEAAGMGDVADELKEAVEGLLDAFEAEGAQVGQDPEGNAGADAPHDAEPGGDPTDGEPGGAFLVEEADDEADEGGLEGAAGGGDAADGDGEEDRRGEGCDRGSGPVREGDHREGHGRGDLEEELEDGGHGGDEAEGDGEARERASSRHLDGGEAAGIARG